MLLDTAHWNDSRTTVVPPADSRRLVIRLFGPLALQDGDRCLGPRDFRGVKPKQVLEILLAARGRLVPKDRLATLLWGDRLPQHFARALETNVSMLRSRLAPGKRSHALVVTGTEAYRFAAERDDVEIDLDRFDDLLDRAACTSMSRARPLLEQALALARGDVLEDEPYAEWAEELRASYRARVLGAHLDAADAALAGCDYRAGVRHAEAAVALDRCAERAHRTAMLALYALGRQHEALARYHRLRSILDEELGLAPTRETRALETAILRQDDVASLLPSATAEQRTPDRSSSLSGRERERETIEHATGAARKGALSLVFVEGGAGVGKTRLVTELAARAGHERVGRAALGELDALVTLAQRHGPLTLLIDDLQWADASTIAALAYLGRRCRDLAVVATVRPQDVAPDHQAARPRPTAVVHPGPLAADDVATLGSLP